MTNTGVLAPGAGTNQSGTTSVGTLNLAGIALTNGSTGTLSIDIGGTTAGNLTS